MINFSWQIRVGSLLVSFLLFSFSFIVFSLWAFIDIDPHHDGIMLKPAVDLIEGKMLFRDSFTQYGALSTLLQAGFCALFGKSLFVLRTLTLLTYSGTFVLLYLTGRRLLASPWVLYVLLLAFIMAPFYASPFYAWSSVFALFFTMLTCYLLTYTEDYPDSNYLWAGLGIASILPFWCRQPCGLAFAAVLLYAIVFRGNQNRTFYAAIGRLFFTCAGALAVSAAVLVWIIFNGAWDEFVYQSFGFAMKFASNTDTASHSKAVLILFEHLIYSITCTKFYFRVFLITLIVCVALLYRTLFRRTSEVMPWGLLGVALVCLSSLHQYYPVAEPNHFYWAALPAFLLYGFAISYLVDLSRQPTAMKYAAVTLGICLAVYPMYKFAKTSWSEYCQNKPSSFSRLSSVDQICRPGPLQGMYVQKEYAEGWNHLCRIVSELPEEYRNLPVLNLTPDALYPLLFANPENWNRSYVNWGNSIDPDYSNKVDSTLRGNNSIVVLYKDQGLEKRVFAHGFRSWNKVKLYFPYVYYQKNCMTASNYPNGRILEIWLPADCSSASGDHDSQRGIAVVGAKSLTNRLDGGRNR